LPASYHPAHLLVIGLVLECHISIHFSYLYECKYLYI
jgi:hypothetical protein